jgi:NAD(P)-dependent dehydrogenase (short-subunit alcohol dehydrogenase family)
MTPRPRTVVVTGSASGMGEATAGLLAAEGWRVIGVDRRDADVVADLGDRAARRRAVDEIADRCDGSLDAAVTFAGISAFTAADGGDVAAVNYFGTVDLLERLAAMLRTGTDPAALAVSSTTATSAPVIDREIVDACLTGDEGAARERARAAGPGAAYAASKVAVARWVRRRAPSPEWAGAGIVLNALVPGMVDTPMTRAMWEDPGAAAMLERIPLPAGRAAAPAEIAEVAHFLISPATRFIVGSLLFVDGGTDAAIRADDWPSARRST